MNKIQRKLNSAKTFVVVNQKPIMRTMIVTLAGTVAIQQIGLKQHDAFLKEHDLYDEFYADPEENEDN